MASYTSPHSFNPMLHRGKVAPSARCSWCEAGYCKACLGSSGEMPSAERPVSRKAGSAGFKSRGMQLINPDLELFGVDISKGGIEKARRLLHTDVGHFLVVDAEKHLPFDDGYFDVIFARGPGLYNQHDMDRPGSIAVIESWHSKLSLQGLFYSIFSSEPRLMGTYTSMEDAKLPFKRVIKKCRFSKNE